jgi:hypothetical protein
MKSITRYLLPLLVLFSLVLSACGGGAATQAPAATESESPATEAPATEAPAGEPTEEPASTEAP